MEHRRSWNTSFSPFQVRSAAACRADDIAALAKKKSALSRTHVTFTHAIFHTQLCHTHIHTYIHTRILSFHIPSCFVTHRLSHSTLSHTTVLPCRSFTTSFVFPSFPVPATTFEAQYWKKLTCRVIRSFNFLCMACCLTNMKQTCLQHVFLSGKRLALASAFWMRGLQDK